MVSFRQGIYQVSWKFDPFFWKIEAEGPQVLGPRQPISSCGNATQVGDVAGHVHRPGAKKSEKSHLGFISSRTKVKGTKWGSPSWKLQQGSWDVSSFRWDWNRSIKEQIDQYQNLYQNLSLFQSMKRQNFKLSLDSTRMEKVSKSWIRLAIGSMSHKETEGIPDPNSLVPLHFPRGLPTDTELNSVE